jgi:predicted Zn-dependent peptidase
MAFKGTQRRNARDISVEIESVGGHLNAYTSRENTAYYARVLADDAARSTSFPTSSSTRCSTRASWRERTVVLQEIGQAEDTPDDIIFDHLQARAFPDQALGRPVLGTAEIVGSLSREAIRGYMREHYSGERLILCAAGKVDHERIVELAAKAFVDLPRAGSAPTDTARYVGGDFRQARDLEQVHLVLGFPGVGYADPDYYAATVYSTLLGGGMSSRLFQEIREKRGLVYSIHSFASSYVDGGLFGIYAGTGEAEVAELAARVARGGQGGRHHRGRGGAGARAQLKAGILMAREAERPLRAAGAATAGLRPAAADGGDHRPRRRRRCGSRWPPSPVACAPARSQSPPSVPSTGSSPTMPSRRG